MVHISSHGEPKPPDVSTFPTPVNHETPLILEEESTTPFFPCPCPFSVPIQVPPCDDNKIWKYANQIPNPYSYPPSIFHDSYPMEEIMEWFMRPMVNNNSSIPQDDITTHNLCLESNLGNCHPLPSLFHYLLSLDLPNQSLSNISSDQVQGSHIS